MTRFALALAAALLTSACGAHPLASVANMAQGAPQARGAAHAPSASAKRAPIDFGSGARAGWTVTQADLNTVDGITEIDLAIANPADQGHKLSFLFRDHGSAQTDEIKSFTMDDQLVPAMLPKIWLRLVLENATVAPDVQAPAAIKLAEQLLAKMAPGG